MTSEANKAEGYISKKELCHLLARSPRSVEMWQRAGMIPYLRINRCCRYKWSEVEAALRKIGLFPQVTLSRRQGAAGGNKTKNKNS